MATIMGAVGERARADCLGCTARAVRCFGPRLLYRFMPGWVTQVTIGMLMGTFVYYEHAVLYAIN
jgi:uncharacterized membrane protein